LFHDPNRGGFFFDTGSGRNSEITSHHINLSDMHRVLRVSEIPLEDTDGYHKAEFMAPNRRVVNLGENWFVICRSGYVQTSHGLSGYGFPEALGRSSCFVTQLP